MFQNKFLKVYGLVGDMTQCICLVLWLYCICVKLCIFEYFAFAIIKAYKFITEKKLKSKGAQTSLLVCQSYTHYSKVMALPERSRSIPQGSFHPDCLSYSDMINLRWHSYTSTDGSQGNFFQRSLSHEQFEDWFKKEKIKMEMPYTHAHSTRDLLSWQQFPTATDNGLNLSTYIKELCGGKYDKKKKFNPKDIKIVGRTSYLLDYQPVDVSFLKENLKNRKRPEAFTEDLRFYTNRIESTYESDFRNFSQRRCSSLDSLVDIST